MNVILRRSDSVDIPLILVIIGLVIVVVSFLVGNSSRSYSDELEKVSISLHQESNNLKKRLNVIEDELMIGVGTVQTSRQSQQRVKPIHEIIINQILSLQGQGFSTEDIAKRASLTSAEVNAVLREKGVI